MKIKLVIFFALLFLLTGFRSSSYFARNFAYTITPISSENLTGLYDADSAEGVFYGNTFKYGTQFLASEKVNPNILGDSDLVKISTTKRIEVDLTNQVLYAIDGVNVDYVFYVSTGLWGKTPTGDFKIWINLKSTLMAGGSKELGTYYYLPNVPYTMYFYNDEISKERGYGLHGAYWHDNFGHPMSHGCVNLSPEDSKTLFYWVNAGLSEDQNVIYNSETYVSPVITIYGIADPY